MAVYNVHGGHNSIVPGANKYLNEVTEDRAVKNKVISYLKAQGHAVYDCTDDSGRTQSANLSNIVKKCNAHNVDLDISIHLNAGGGTGTEVLYYSGSSEGKNIATKVSEKVSNVFGWKNRGAKARSDLYVLNNTKAVAILVECCFVDSQSDAQKWDADKCAKAIVEAVTGKVVSSGGSSSSSDSTGKTVQLYSSNQTDAQIWIAHKHSNGKYSIENKSCKFYLDARNAKTSNGTEVWAYPWNNTVAQRWALDADENGEISNETVIRSALDENAVLDVSGASKENGAKIQLYRFNDSTAQKWNFIPSGGENEYYIINSVSGKALDVKGGGK